ncbi:MAG: suppressor of fused domain protein [Myxococcales bacterium]|nr:suppressor of fused domain protein [Myxococcales bacterium]
MSQAAADALIVEALALFRDERFSEAAERYEKAAAVFPGHALAWKGLGHCLLCLGQPHDATRAFDQAIGLAPSSATALWGGRLPTRRSGTRSSRSATSGARSHCSRPGSRWRGACRRSPCSSSRARAPPSNSMRPSGAFSTRAYRHPGEPTRTLEVARILDQPAIGTWTFVTIGLSNHVWPDAERPRIELILASTIDTEVCGQILADLAFHLSETGLYPEPGVVVRDMIASDDLSHRLPHVYITVPRAWRLELPLDLGPPPVTLAQAVPISELEYEVWRADPTALEASFATRRVVLADLRRIGG